MPTDIDRINYFQTLQKSFDKYNRKAAQNPREAQIRNVLRDDGFNARYDIRFRDGATAQNVSGQSGFKPRDAVLVTVMQGVKTRYTIIGRAYSLNAEIITEIEV